MKTLLAESLLFLVIKELYSHLSTLRLPFSSHNAFWDINFLIRKNFSPFIYVGPRFAFREEQNSRSDDPLNRRKDHE